jgi:hypothetical protein
MNDENKNKEFIYFNNAKIKAWNLYNQYDEAF